MADCNCGAFEAEGIVKYGYMMIKRPPTSAKVRIKAWQSKFFVLHDMTHNIPQRLEYYKDETAFEFQKPAEHCIYLDSIVYIGETQSSKSHCYPIMVVCSKQGAYTLACDTEEATKDWIQVLNRVAVKIGGNGSPDIWMQASVDDSPASTPELPRRACSELSTALSGSSQNLEEQLPQGRLTRTRTITPTTRTGYFVTTRLTPQAEKNNIRGDYILRITDGEVVLQSTDRGLTVVTWPVGHLRSFKSEAAVSSGMKDMQLLTLSTGTRSATGEGIFQFFTKHGDTIADEIRLQSQHAFKSAAEKRNAFQRRSSTGSDGKSPPPARPGKNISRAMTAPPEKLANMLLKKDRGSLMESLKRARAETDPSVGQNVEPNSSTVAANGAANGLSNDTRPRSATDSSVEKTGDDEVFLSQQYCEIGNEDSIKEEPDGNAYIELVEDETAEPIHISDPVPSRKISSESQTSSCSLASDEGSMRTSSLPRNFSGAQLIPEENEMDSEGYIKCEALEDNSLDGNGNHVDFFVSENLAEVCETSASQSGRQSSSPVEVTSPRSGAQQLASANARINRKMHESLVAQIRDPNDDTFPPKPKLERERPLMSENVFPPKPRTDKEESRYTADSIDTAHDLLEKARDPESSKKMLDQIIAQMEKPQQHDVSELFPAITRKRNSIGAMSIETVREAQQKVKEKHSHSVSYKKHSMIEKSKSTCEGFSPRALSPGPPPLPLRPDSSEVTRRRGCSSVGDISEDLPKRPDLTSAHRSTFFAKGMGSVNPQTLTTPLRGNFTAGHLSGEAAIHARLIEKTEIRDEMAQSSSARCKAAETAGEDVSSCSIANGATSCLLADETIANSTENLDEDAQGEMGKRKDSKASKFVKKVWKRAPKPRRGSNESREICEEHPTPSSERPRRESLSPGDALELQGRFSGSEQNTPETSPQMKRKNSHKTSSDEKLKRDKESSASKILRKVTKGDLKKEEPCQKHSVRKTSREESPKKDSSSTGSTTKPLPPQHKKASPPEKARKDSKGERPKESYKSEEMADGFNQTDGQLWRVSNTTESQHTPTNDVVDPAPALPPRKKFEPPPLPPRLSKSSPSLNSVTPPVHSTPPHHGTRPQQPAAPPSKEGRRHSSSGRRHSGSGMKEELLPPPPVPPRNTQSPEPKKIQPNERPSTRAPVIQLTCSSPENRDDASEKRSSESEEDVFSETAGKAQEQTPPIMSATHQSPESLSHPVPRRPPKGERRTQAKEFFRTHASQHVYVPSSDSEGGELEDSDFPPLSPRYGNIDELRMAAMKTSEEEGTLSEECATCEETKTQTHENTESNCTKSPVNLSREEIRVIKSQREAMRLKINLMKESSVDGDTPSEGDDTDGEQSKPRRPATPRSIQRNAFTLSSVSIN